MIDYTFIGARLKEARIRKNMTQEKLAAMTDVGVYTYQPYCNRHDDSQHKAACANDECSGL